MSHEADTKVSSRRQLRIFLAEDDPQMRRMIAEALRRDGHFVLEASDGAALLRDLGHAFWGERAGTDDSVIISDGRMPGCGGLAVLRTIRQFAWCPPFILITAFGDPALHEEARRLNVERVFDKPFDIAELRALVKRLAVAPPQPVPAMAPNPG